MITHDLDLLWQVTDRVAVLAEGRVQGVGSMAELARMEHPAIRPFFEGPRARSAQPHMRKPASPAVEAPRPEPLKEPSSKPK
jgi:phospholipid/cholesterol/gamma-HCH transport system ATP-binding protein